MNSMLLKSTDFNYRQKVILSKNPIREAFDSFNIFNFKINYVYVTDVSKYQKTGISEFKSVSTLDDQIIYRDSFDIIERVV